MLSSWSSTHFQSTINPSNPSQPCEWHAHMRVPENGFAILNLRSDLSRTLFLDILAVLYVTSNKNASLERFTYYQGEKLIVLSISTYLSIIPMHASYFSIHNALWPNYIPANLSMSLYRCITVARFPSSHVRHHVPQWHHPHSPTHTRPGPCYMGHVQCP